MQENIVIVAIMVRNPFLKKKHIEFKPRSKVKMPKEISNMQAYKDNFVQYILSIPRLVTAGPILGKLLRHWDLHRISINMGTADIKLGHNCINSH